MHFHIFCPRKPSKGPPPRPKFEKARMSCSYPIPNAPSSPISDRSDVKNFKRDIVDTYLHASRVLALTRPNKSGFLLHEGKAWTGIQSQYDWFMLIMIWLSMIVPWCTLGGWTRYFVLSSMPPTNRDEWMGWQEGWAFSTEGLYVGPLSVEEFLEERVSTSSALWDWTQLSPGVRTANPWGWSWEFKTTEVGWRDLEKREWTWGQANGEMGGGEGARQSLRRLEGRQREKSIDRWVLLFKVCLCRLFPIYVVHFPSPAYWLFWYS